MSVNPKNILYFSSFGNLRWGGQKSLYHLVNRVNHEKYRPYVLLPTDDDFSEALRQKDIKVVIRNLPPIRVFNLFQILSTVRFLIRLIDDFEIALVHTDGPRNTFYAGLAAKIKQRPIVWHVRSSEKDRYDALLIPLCTKIILVANALRSRFSMARSDKKFTTIYNGVDLGEFDGDATLHPPIRSAHHLDERSILIGSFGRIESMKGQLHLIEACAKIKNSFPFKLFLFGEIYDPDYYQSCIQTVEESGLREHVIFGNHQKNVASLLKGMDLVVSSSVFGEAFPRSIIEAMAAAKPVIATDIGGCAEAVENEASGFIVPPKNASALAEVLLKLGKDKRLRDRIGLAARIRAEKMFTIEENVRQTEKVYHALIADKQLPSDELSRS